MKYLIEDGKPILGATLDGDFTNFAIFSKNATKVTIEIYENSNDTKPIFNYQLNEMYNKTGDIWHVKIKGIGHGSIYGWKVDGPYDMEHGHRFDSNKLLLDPYGRSVVKVSKDPIYKSVVVDDQYDWEGVLRPKIPMKDTIIYEMHVRLFTKSDTSGVVFNGTLKGVLEKLDHLKKLGVTTLELLPVYDFNVDSNDNINPLTGERLYDVWGYNPNNFFAVAKHYTNAIEEGDEVVCFKDFVKAVHKAGMEVILDVVYNHTGEGNERGPTLNFKGIDNQIYYMLSPYDKKYYSNYSGTGNTFNCNHPVVKQLILDSLRYWVTEMRVDGFRFDLASILGRDSNGQWIGEYSMLTDIAKDPILADTKLISESWDAGGGYHLGEMPAGFAEWNGKYRDTIRNFLNGGINTISDLATCITGSPNLFKGEGRGPLDSINFITAHDGFTMWDLFSYNNKHNLANGEDNRDGTNDNISNNYGAEGETDNKDIIAIRKKQVKNAITLLMISQGVPMIVMGDEFCRTQKGNNNPYCQDNEISWVDWKRKDEFGDIYDYFCKIINFRKEHPSLRREKFLSQDSKGGITWHGVEADYPDWAYYSRTIAFMLHNNMKDGFKDDQDIYVAINGYEEPLTFMLPDTDYGRWYRVVDTGRDWPDDFLDKPKIIEDNKYKVDSYSILICVSI
ncbi:MAG: glycogen-debranching protein [Epulopiscium sp.]|nr:glycogen-debranching protein [Candidatus Epulonipiscium sp.]